MGTSIGSTAKLRPMKSRRRRLEILSIAPPSLSRTSFLVVSFKSKFILHASTQQFFKNVFKSRFSFGLFKTISFVLAPGTGKTSLIVEAVAQILALKPESRVLITTQSNSACDEIGIRLLKYVSPNNIFRWYSPSLLDPKKDKSNPVLKSTSNLRNKKNKNLTLEEFRHFKVIISTLLTCSKINQQNVKGLGAKHTLNQHFDYIFIDECAAASEPDALVPIAGKYFSKILLNYRLEVFF